ncbi:uncharacterized protein LOC143041313 [Oratosquilla oratoria]|uniref:uncharacterized protein LOC143041313 n=1 Tax=Oratosquilla oratoria TaxID=337810 RepID=UPI003F77661A
MRNSPAPHDLGSLKVLQWNMQGIRNKKHQLLQTIMEEGMDIVLLQETLAPGDFEWRIGGYTVHSLPLDRGIGHRGCMVLVKNNLPHRRVARPVHCGEGVEVMAVELLLPDLPLLIYNIYRSPGKPDHYAVITTLRAALPLPPLQPPRWDLRRADWKKFQAALDDWWKACDPPEDLDQRETEFTTAIERAAEAAIPRRHPGHRWRRNWWFYNEEVREQNHLVNIHRKLYRKRPTSTNLQLLKEVVTHARQVSSRVREAKWLEWCASFSQHTSLADLWAKLRTASGKRAPRPASHPEPQQEAERLADMFATRCANSQLPAQMQNLQQQLRPAREQAVGTARATPDVTDVPFTPQELARAKKGRDTATGADGVTYSMLAHAGPAGEAALLALMNHSWLVGRLPTTWKRADIQPIPKPREPSKPRPISLLSCTAKTAERMVLTRLMWRLGPLHPHIFGFSKGVGTADSIMTLLSHIDNRPAVAVFLDLEKAFELASAHAILDALVQRGVQGRLLSWIEDYLLHRRARVRFQGHLSAYRDLENGTPQGGVLSPVLFNLLMEQLVSLPFRGGTALLSYADDLVLVVSGKTRGNRITRAQEGLDLISNKCEELGLKISAEKSKALMLKATTPDTHLHIQGIQLAWTSSYQYLGVWVDQGLSFNTQVTYLRERTRTRINVMRAMTRTHSGASHAVLRLYYIQAVRSLIDYSAVVLVSLSPTQQRRIECIQNQAMRTMLGAPRWTSMSIMQSETRLVPLASRVQHIATCRVAKILRQDRETIARTKIKRTLPQRRDLFSTNTWLRRIADATNALFDDGQIAMWSPDLAVANYVVPAPWQPPPVEIIINNPPARKAQCTQHELWLHALASVTQASIPGGAVYYTDGSVDPVRGTTGAAAVTGGETLSWRTPDHCSTLQTEELCSTTAPSAGGEPVTGLKPLPGEDFLRRPPARRNQTLLQAQAQRWRQERTPEAQGPFKRCSHKKIPPKGRTSS